MMATPQSRRSEIHGATVASPFHRSAPTYAATFRRSLQRSTIDAIDVQRIVLLRFRPKYLMLQISKGIGKAGDYVIERAFVEK